MNHAERRPGWRRAAALALILAAGGDDERRGLELYRAGKYTEAAAAFRAAIAADGPRAPLCYNLALALWRAGDADGAETAAEQAATLSDGELAALRDGILGNLRHAAARAAADGEPPDLPKALELARQSRDHFQRGALRPRAPAELARNLERALRLIEELEKKLEDQQKEKDQDPKDQDPKDQDSKDQDSKDQDPKQDQQKGDQQQDPKDQQKGDQQQDPKRDQQKGDQQQDPKRDQPKGDQQPGEPKPQDSGQPPPDTQDRQEPDAGAPPEGEAGQNPPPPPADAPAPGEQDPAKQLSPEQRQRLLEILRKIDEERQRLRAVQRARRPPVEKDW